jgi:phage terminase large subunit-like protein
MATSTKGGMYDHIDFDRIGVSEAELPEFKRVVVWVDPAVSSTDQSDSMGICCDALGVDKRYYRLWSWESVTSPLDALKRAITKAIEWRAEKVGVETDQGGDTWEIVYKQACEELRDEGILIGPAPKFDWEKAGAGHGSKIVRSQRMLVDYERDKFRHLRGTTGTLEHALERFPRVKPFDLVDASYWSWADLANKLHRRRSRFRSAAGDKLGPGNLNPN